MATVSAPLRVAAQRMAFRSATVPPILIVCFLAGFLFFFRLGHRELYSSHEARAAQNAQRMLDTGEWGLPVLFDGQADLQKPPGYYWLVAAFGWLNDGEVTGWAARLPAALAGLLTVTLVFAFLRREGRPVAAWVAAIALATAVHFTAIARTARIDVPLTCAVTASLLALYRGCRPDAKYRTLWHLLSAVAAALGVLLKGPVALALIGPTAVIWLIGTRLIPGRRDEKNPSPGPSPKKGGEKEINHPLAPPSFPGKGVGGLGPSTPADRPRLPLASVLLGTLAVFVIAAPWFLWANHVTHGEFLKVFFWHHNVERFAGTSPTLASHPVWYYGPRFAADFLPWTPALVLLVWRALRSGQWRQDRVLGFGLTWLAVMFVVLSTAHFKRADYLLPLYPGAAIALGCAAEAWLASRQSLRTVRAAKWGFGVTLAGVVVGWQVMTFAVEPAEQGREEKRAFAEAIRAHAPAPHEVMLFRAESHLLAFRLGRPLLTRVEWHDLNDWLAEPGPHVVVMPPEYVYPAQQIVRSRRLVEVVHLGDFTPDAPPRPLVLLRTAD